MAQAKGSKVRLLLDYETVFGTDPGVPAAFIMPVNEISLEGGQAKISPKTLRGIRDPYKPFAGNIDASGPIIVPVDYTAFWYWLKLMFGDPATTGAGPYEHVFTVGDTQPSAVLEKQFTDNASYWKYNGCKIASWNISFGGDGELISTFNIVGMKENDASGSPFDAAPTSLSLGRLNNFEASVDEGGSSSDEIISLDLTVDFGLDIEQRAIGSEGARSSIPEGILEVSGALVAQYNDDVLIAKGFNDTETSLKITITSGTNILEIDIQELEYERFQTMVTGPQGVQQTTNIFPFYDNGADASVVKVTLTNDDAHP